MKPNEIAISEGQMNTIRCEGCGADIPEVVNFCPVCGFNVTRQETEKPVPPEQTSYVAVPRQVKRKDTALILAIFFSSFGFLYTIKSDYRKFIPCTFLNGVGFFSLYVLLLTNTTWQEEGIFGTALPLTIPPVWIYSIIIAGSRSRSFYETYDETE